MAHHSLTELEAVLAIVRCGSFRAAALELGMSTTAISNAVGKLERELAVRLFNRTTRSVSLTYAGRIFVAQIKPALEDIQKAMDTARSQQETPSGTLRINAFATAGREIMAPLVLSYLQRYPQVHIDIVTEGRLVDIVAAGFDLAVRSAGLVPTDAIAIPLGQKRRITVAASPAFFEHRAVPKVPQELLSYPCVRGRLPDGALLRWRFEKGGEELQVDVEGPITLDEASLTRIAVTNGVGIGYFMETDVREDIAAGRLVRILEDWTPPLEPLCLYYYNRRNSSAAFQAFIALAREFAAGRLVQP
ncbi:LysR family transcriptional regulator [Paracoccus aerius]|uniref:LysR family transcriptional regulator n=1 Tax=Paracoccus aerius TaxID=1915382 RepID=A0ABS1S9T8_9RHOB|nr:LysR family transcriptional regulator [Paracoccus aerius]MBL3675500.1 LysR family transcriptional regulator [Paracoccus aerius]GHG34555.1 LysR family transcriptional regulator [Paracoccus aerius]